MTKVKDPIQKPRKPREDFFMRERANEGVVLHLRTPDGEETGEWLRVVGIDSDVFAKARVDSNRRVVDIIQAFSYEGDDPKEKEAAQERRKEALRQEERRLGASLVSAWSWDDPPTPESVYQLFTEAPQIYREVDELSCKRAAFFKRGSGSSPDTQKKSSS
jgi:hypothetical protein